VGVGASRGGAGKILRVGRGHGRGEERDAEEEEEDGDANYEPRTALLVPRTP
jgi:hypothetical protein